MRARGFSLVELIIVLAIAGILLAIAIPAVTGYIERSRMAQAETDIADMSTKIKAQERALGFLPDSLSTVKAADGTNIDYSTRLDPWGSPYQYLNLATNKGNGLARKDKKLAPLNSDFDLYSMGKDQQTAASLVNSVSRDDIVRARDGGFIGLASDFDP